jgi:hypothetical protein
MHIKFIFIVQRYGLMSVAALGAFCTANVVLTRIQWCSDPEGRSRAVDRNIEDTGPGLVSDACFDYFIKAAI